MPITPNNDKKVCTLCKRHKEQIIREQLEERKSCGHQGCDFKSEIKEALKNKDKVKIRKISSPRINIRKILSQIAFLIIV